MTIIYNAQKWSKRIYEKVVQKKNHRYKNILHLVSFRWKKSCLNNILMMIYFSVNIYQSFFLQAQSFLRSAARGASVRGRNQQATCGNFVLDGRACACL